MHRFLPAWTVVWAVSAILLGLSPVPSIRAAAAAAPVNYEREVAPILRAYCAGCHNDADKEGTFSVETFARLRTGGNKGDPIRPRDPDQSFLIRSIEGKAKPHMPPRDEPQVPEAELAVLRRWITEGAAGPASDASILAHLVAPKIPVGAAVARRTPVTALEFSPSGDRLAVGTPGRIEIRSSPSRAGKKAFEGIPGKVNAVHFSRDGKSIIAATGIPGLQGVVQTWNLDGSKAQRSFAGHRDTVHDAVISPDGTTMVSAGYDRTLRFWDLASGRCVRTNAVHNGAVFRLAFSPSGRVLASASADQTVKLWRVSDGVRLDTLNQPQGELNAVVFTPDSKHILAAGVDRRIHQWRFSSTNEPALNPVVQSRFAHEAAITALAVSVDGRWLASAASDRTLKLWRLPELVEAKAWSQQSDVIGALAFDPKRPRLVVGRMDGTVEVISGFDSPEPIAKSAVQHPTQSAVAKETQGAATGRVPVKESEPNDTPEQAMRVEWPAEIHGSIDRAGDRDLYRFRAQAGQAVTFAINAAQSGSLLDSRVEILTPDGRPVPQIRLQAVRDSWFNFRGKDSETADDFRLQNWAEMELDEYLYANGEVVRLWLYPRGPDSGFKLYPGEGRRQPAFGTSALTHALNEPCYIVRPIPNGAPIVPNGLPVFQPHFENDDDPSRLAGTDSLVRFVAPATGEYLARVTDVRGFGAPTNHHYTLSIREPRPEFSVRLDTTDPSVSPGSARELQFVATRREGFEGPIRIQLANLPPGFSSSAPVEIEANQIRASATLSAATNAVTPDAAALSRITLKAVARIGDRDVEHPLGSLGKLKVGPAPKLTVEILPGADPATVRSVPGQPLEFLIRAGQTISARVRADRRDFKDRIEFGNEDSGRNLPHGLYIDNIGLNGLLIVEGQSERDFFITASPIAKPGTRLFHLRTGGDGGQCSPVARITVLPPVQTAGR